MMHGRQQLVVVTLLDAVHRVKHVEVNVLRVDGVETQVVVEAVTVESVIRHNM